MPCRPVIVLGYQRSGTSLTAEVVARWGAYPGRLEQLMAADRYNEQGYWEYTPLLSLFRSLARLAGHRTPTITYFTVDQVAVRQAAAVPRVREEALRLVAEMEQSGRPWMWKDPALTCFLPFFLRIWDRPVFLITVRDPVCSARSWQEMLLPGREEWTGAVDAWLVQWHRCLGLACEQTEGYPRLFVQFERLLTQADVEVDRICTFLGEYTGISASPSTIASMTRTVRSTLRHQASQPARSGAAAMSREQSALYTDLQAASRDVGPGRVATPNLPSGWSALLDAQESEILYELNITG